MEIVVDPYEHLGILNALNKVQKVIDSAFLLRGRFNPTVVAAGGCVRDFMLREYGNRENAFTRDIDIFVLGYNHIMGEADDVVFAEKLVEAGFHTIPICWEDCMNYARSGNILVAGLEDTGNPNYPEIQVMISKATTPGQLIDNFDFDINQGYAILSPSRESLIIHHKFQNEFDWMKLTSGITKARITSYHPTKEVLEKRIEKFSSRFGIKFECPKGYSKA